MKPLVVSAVTLALLLAPAADAARRPVRSVPRGFVGVTATGPVLSPSVDLEREFGLMAQAGVESVRIPVHWADVQPYQTWADVPAAEGPRFRDSRGVPTDFAETDRLVAAATQWRIRVLPVVLQAPAWARKHPSRLGSPPAGAAAFGRFMKTLVLRYGGRGSFWSERADLPRLPVREWQIWNEPNGVLFWDDRPPYEGPDAAYQPDYVALLRAARASVRAADANAKTVMAGFFGEGNLTLDFLFRFDPSVGRYVDAVALHPFTRRPADVLLIVRRVRAVLRRHGYPRLPIQITETSWPSAAGRPNQDFGFEVSQAGQAQRLQRMFRMFASARRRLGVTRVYWFSWASIDSGRFTFDYAGLRRLDGPGPSVAKPAYGALRRVALGLEGCRGKLTASACA
jgi:polysaccharide biosynthesis protein PslG